MSRERSLFKELKFSSNYRLIFALTNGPEMHLFVLRVHCFNGTTVWKVE